MSTTAAIVCIVLAIAAVIFIDRATRGWDDED